MHGEAIAYTRQTMGYAAPALPVVRSEAFAGGWLAGDAAVPGGRFRLGAEDDGSFCFDNEAWAHDVEVAPFAIARAPVAEGDLARFVEDGGYRRRELWSEEGWARRCDEGWEAPRYWRRIDGAWQRRHFDRWVDLERALPAIHVSFHEAEAYARRLPSELEWEVAAAGVPDARGGLAPEKRRYPWGDAAPTPDRANLDARAMSCIDVGALPAGDSAFGCRQMIGNVWEWTADSFAPYPGFAAGPYKEYSEPLFGTTKVLRGGAWVTRSRLIRNTWRNFYEPHRRDVWAGFRTCAL
jgi:iron(II)-dependent oxidoreductase